MGTGEAMTFQWTHTGQRYGADDVSYLKAAHWLDDGPVEDWGGGPGYARQFFHHGYKVVDGTSWEGVDTVADLTGHISYTHGILLRHVLEHNEYWWIILKNALISAEKLAIVIFTPFSDHTHVMKVNPNGSPDISFLKDDLIRMFDTQKWHEETFSSATQYGQETIFYVG